MVPRELVLGNAGYCQAMIGFDPPLGTYVHVCGIDIIRDETGRFLVLEDNARTPVRRRLRGGEPPHDAARACPT